MANKHPGVLTDENGKTTLALSYVLDAFGLHYQADGSDLVFFRGPIADGAVIGRTARAVLSPTALAALLEGQ